MTGKATRKAPEVLMDANVLLRYLTGEPEAMADRARGLLERAGRGELHLVLTPLTVAECVWVLKSFYKHSYPAIADALQQVLDLDGLRMQQGEVVTNALVSMARNNVDFADAYLAELGKAEGVAVATFEGVFQRLGGQVLTP